MCGLTAFLRSSPTHIALILNTKKSWVLALDQYGLVHQVVRLNA